MGRSALACAALLLGTGCARDEGPRWIRLAERFEAPRLDLPADGLAFETADGRPVRLVRRGGEPWIETELRRADWTFNPRHGDWSTAMPILGRGSPSDGSPPHRLVGKEAYVSRELGAFRGDDERPAGSYLIKPERLRLFLGEGREPEERTRLALYAGAGRRSGQAWRVAGRRFSGDALALWPGQEIELEVDVPAGSALRFATCVEPALGRSAPRGLVGFRVSVGGAPVFAHEQEDAHAGTFAWHAVDLPAGPVRLAFAVDGPPSYAAFLAPVIGPREVGRPGARPWGGARRDLVVFQADTFRADNLSAWGGDGDLAPAIEAAAREALVFRRAWSVGTYTLPAHAAMFTGVYPRQAGIVGMHSSVPENLETVAEVLSRAGYRTGAVTDSVYVSQRFGLAQGFEWFEERLDGGLESTLERVAAFLAADDGRPVFLFVQTYHVHTPYRVSDETLRERGAELGIEGDFTTLRSEHAALAKAKATATPEEVARRLELSELLRAHYLGGVVDLDQGFERFLAHLRGAGWLDRGVMVFTSDHGEAFEEHEAMYHGGPAWEVLVRVPLFLLGEGIEPGAVERAASLIDLPRTLADLADVPAPDAWLGTSLVGSVPERAMYAFQCKDGERLTTWAVVEGAHKLIGREGVDPLAEGALLGAFDLERDPAEGDDQSQAEDWPRALLERHHARVSELSVPLQGLEGAALGAEDLRELEAMGYGGEVPE